MSTTEISKRAGWRNTVKRKMTARQLANALACAGSVTAADLADAAAQGAKL